jgi:hypothetical protein
VLQNTSPFTFYFFYYNITLSGLDVIVIVHLPALPMDIHQATRQAA